MDALLDPNGMNKATYVDIKVAVSHITSSWTSPQTHEYFMMILYLMTNTYVDDAQTYGTKKKIFFFNT